MTSSQVVFWKAVILASCTVGVVLLLIPLVTAQILTLPIGVVFIVFGVGMAVILRRETKAR